ncbi:MAG TPA: STAS/SEC14 domain-containing protein [Flavobacteriales bacterium]|nr:STAS/SEC14 domain-containing protein [Flavobacteriales bacterium]
MEIPANVKIIDWPTSTMWFDENGFLCSISKNYSPSSYEENLYWFEALRKLANGKKLCVLVDINEASRLQQKDAEFVTKNLHEIIKAQAMISNSYTTRFISNLVLGFKPPKFPMRMFTNEIDARAWLTQHME